MGEAFILCNCGWLGNVAPPMGGEPGQGRVKPCGGVSSPGAGFGFKEVVCDKGVGFGGPVCAVDPERLPVGAMMVDVITA